MGQVKINHTVYTATKLWNCKCAAGPPPDKQEVQHRMSGNFLDGWTVEWLPLELGVHTIEIKYGDGHIVGSPFRCKVYDLSKVRIIRDRTTPGINLGGNPDDDVVFYGEP